MKERIKNLVQKKGPLSEDQVKDLLTTYNIPTTKYRVVTKEQELETIDLKFPVALKLCSNKILHKTDVGGVKLNIQTIEELHKTFNEFRQRFPSDVFLVDQMEEKGIEIIIGLIHDSIFGLSTMIGIGGIFTELYKDVSFRIVPIDEYDAAEMINELKGKQLLEGFRNMEVDKKLVIDLLLKISELGQELSDYIDQMDLNPVFVYKDNLCVIDAKLILK